MSKAAKAKATKKTAKAPEVKPGEVISRVYKGKTIKVTATETGYRHDGKDYSSLTAVAKAVTGYPAISGPAFFKPGKNGAKE